PKRKPDARGTQRPRHGRPCMFREFIAQKAFDRGTPFLAIPMATLELKGGRPAPSTEKTNKSRAENDDGKRNIEKEDPNKRGRSQQAHCIILQRSLAYAEHRF